MPNKIFISYRRKESQDITGRVHDGIAGYFGADAVFMDVDALVSGKEYRAQIGSLINRCGVLLAIIGEDWLECTDDRGTRRLDDPDDLLRIEIQTAIENGLTVIPILVHGAALPASDRLPEALASLAGQRPVEIQSGLPFRTDIRKLIDRLETQHDIRHPDHRFPWEFIAIPLGIALILISITSFQKISDTQLYALQQMVPLVPLESSNFQSLGAQEGTIYNHDHYREELIQFFWWCIVPGGLGPMVIVFGKRICCGRKDRQRKRAFYLTGAMQVPSAKSRKAVICVALGLASICWGLATTVPAVVLGLAAFRDLNHYHGWMRGRTLAWIGILGALAGGAFATYRQHDLWTQDAWLTSMEQSHQWEQANQPDRAVDAGAAALHLEIGPIGRCVALGKRSALLAGQGELEAAIESISESIELGLANQESNDNYAQNLQNLLRDAYGTRSKFHVELGQLEKAKADHDRMINLPGNFKQPDAEPWNRAPGDDLDPVPPEPEAPPMPPMPVADPSA